MRIVSLLIVGMVIAATHVHAQPVLSFKGIRVGMSWQELKAFVDTSDFHVWRPIDSTTCESLMPKDYHMKDSTFTLVACKSIGPYSRCVHMDGVMPNLYDGKVYHLSVPFESINENEEPSIALDADVIVSALTERFGPPSKSRPVTQRAIDSAHYPVHGRNFDEPAFPEFARWEWYAGTGKKKVLLYTVRVYLSFSQGGGSTEPYFKLWVAMTDEIAADHKYQENMREADQRIKKEEYDRAHPKVRTKF